MTARISFKGGREEAELLSDRLDAAFEEEGGVVALSEAGTDWQVELYLEGDELDPLGARLSDALGADASKFDIEILPETDWVAQSLKGLAPVPAGRFVVYGAHDRSAIPAGRTGIEIDAGQAFGTGHHATTLGCLETLDELLKYRRFDRPLDVGTGTGLLAIALARLLREPVLASDIDPIATKIAAENASLNGVGHLVETMTAMGLRHPRIAACAPYDLIVANILAAPLIALAPEMARASETDGVVVLSGILNSQASRVTAAYRNQGFALETHRRFGEWSVLVLSHRM
ncbi:ribosomal protein L11 methyltransferase [Rhodopseudomonas julia]|uniref:Ribosomal protein L11 methyltransferase n=1 Tax=Rhodopseudomonas julia TaxID=200617 RepID=A0ABU0C874_9BRAD|nr:50S ribosomal protein L11 methyltransferase [Rhodopseudomonas julia]MDQ0326674.1 ribosomal protein L11 methyltransferase [Rhodopseudomonas julia]